MPLRRYTVWIVEVWRDNTHSIKVFDGIYGKPEADEYAMVEEKRLDSSGKRARVEKWEMTREGKKT